MVKRREKREKEKKEEMEGRVKMAKRTSQNAGARVNLAAAFARAAQQPTLFMAPLNDSPHATLYKERMIPRKKEIPKREMS